MSNYVVIDASPGQDDLRVVTDFLCFVSQIIRIHAYAMTSYQAGAEWQEVPFSPSSLQHLECVDAQFVKDQTEFIHQRDIHVALRVLDHLRRLGHLDAASLVGAGSDDLLI
ncbi:hypothetical protein D3C71_1588440 [compost metagenome]